MLSSIARPQEGEYNPYTIAYIKLVPADGDVIGHLKKNYNIIRKHIEAFSADKLTTPHEAGEWTIHEILVHVLDAERVFAYRALRIARGDTTPLPGFEQDDYVAPSKANARDIKSILEEYRAVRDATTTLFESFDDDILMNSTLTSGAKTTLRAIMYITAGHELHHLYSIKENYG